MQPGWVSQTANGECRFYYEAFWNRERHARPFMIEANHTMRVPAKFKSLQHHKATRGSCVEGMCGRWMLLSRFW